MLTIVEDCQLIMEANHYIYIGEYSGLVACGGS